MGKFVNPFTDIGVKVTLGSELSKDMLIFFLNGLLKGEYEVIDLTFLDKEEHGGNVNECDTLFEKWLYALKNMDKWDRMPDALKEQVFQRLAQLAEVANLSEDNRVAYDKALDYYYIDETVRYDDYMKGREEGIKKVAIQMLQKGIPVDTIAQCTDLTATEITTLN